MAIDINQKPPMMIPISARSPIKTLAFGANATITPDAIINRVRDTSTMRRSIPCVADVMTRLVRTALLLHHTPCSSNTRRAIVTAVFAVGQPA